MPTPSSTKTTFMATEKTTVMEFDAIRLKLASPEEIHGWSTGEVLKPETINYRTQKPEKDGLFCEKIFGPTKDWECYCGKYKRIRYKGITCDKCGVEVTRAVVRRERMGHIDLAAPVSHIWFLRGIPSKIGLVLDLSIQNLEKVIYFASFIVGHVDDAARKETTDQIKAELQNKRKQIDNEFNQRSQEINKRKAKLLADGEVKGKAEKKIEEELMSLNVAKIDKIKSLEEAADIALKELKDLKVLQIVSENKYQELALRYGHVFEANIGAEAIRDLLKKVDLKKLYEAIEAEIKVAIASKQKKLIRRSRLVKSLLNNKIKPEWMVMSAIPVIPPDLRPMVQLDGGRFASSDLNDLYRRVINRNNRLKRLKDLSAPEVIQRNEKRMLQEAVDSLIDNNARHGKTVTASTGQKRTLKSIADMLKGKQGRFRQNLLGKRVDYSGRSVIVVGPHLKIGQCGLPKTMALELFRPFVISKLIKAELVYNVRSANRFIEAGHPEVWAILEEVVKGAHVLLNRAPTLHRLGIQAFQPVLIEGKAIHLHPLVCSAFNADFDGDQMAVHVPLTEEAKTEAKNIMLSTANLLKPATGEPIVTPSQDIVWGVYYMTYIHPGSKVTKYFTDENEAERAFILEEIKLQDPIKIRAQRADNKIIETSIGRILFNSVLPKEMGYVNDLIDKKGLKNIIAESFRLFSHDETVKLLDDVKDIAFEFITSSGMSWGMDDIPKLECKAELMKEAETRIEEIKGQYNNGLLTNKERYVKVIEVWTDIKNKITEKSQNIFDPTNSVSNIINSGARGSWSQMIQIMGMKGLVINPAGDIIELPVKANFQEGLDVLEYFISTHGTRKGLSDTALRTASAGYLTRRLVDVSQDVVILEEDCKDKEGHILTREESKEINEPIADRVVGRVLIDGIRDPKTEKITIKANTLVNKDLSEEIREMDLDRVKIRSLLTCKSVRGACRKCYGYDLGYNKLVEMGTAVGIVAAQSIGEPGTQLTMRTFHTGGVAEGDITQGLPRVEELFEARPPKKRSIIAPITGIVEIDDDTALFSKDQKIIKIKPQEARIAKYDISKGTDKRVKNGEEVSKDQLLYIAKETEIRAGFDGVIKLTEKQLQLISKDKEVHEVIIPAGYNLWIKDKELVMEGQQITEGSIDLHELFEVSGKLDVQEYVMKEIKHIYSSQGQNLNDKHVELIVRQMFSRFLVKEVGETELLPGEVITSTQFNEANNKVSSKATGEVLLLGITKAALTSDSFLSAASFQETARVLIDAAISGKVDRLRGLKENVIIGRKIPAGTGFIGKK
ncbi:DNA-directed RNA polymerase subunit beta' [Candidatus Parcubacteria bacterium]|jgi:DNA-directed RNA polymerase subunit beta'|nr:DNA-directed RNA polymerase subunit beta' [Candidatus Parcubacteria bacterium]MBT7228428.1 DNA-directed RNA polymerase subunit beta' [Candidatus Parcubacteria bacterium]